MVTEVSLTITGGIIVDRSVQCSKGVLLGHWVDDVHSVITSLIFQKTGRYHCHVVCPNTGKRTVVHILPIRTVN